MFFKKFRKNKRDFYPFACPICQTTYDSPSLRYYNILICGACSNRAVDKNGRKVTFFEGFERIEENNSVIHRHIGLVGEYVETGKEYLSAEFFIDGFECHAEEGHFGGVVYLFGKDE